MRRMIRWQYWLPRAMLLVVLLLAVQYTLGRLVRSSIIRAGETVVGGKVELGGARVSLAKAQVVLHDLRIADRHAPARNLLRADSCRLNFSAGALLHKQAVVERGEVVGLRIGTPRDASEAPSVSAVVEPSPAAWFDSQPAELAQDWLEQLERQFNRDLVSEFESVRLADELVARWPQQSAALHERLRQLRRRAAELEAGVHEVQVNPLRHTEFLDSLSDEVASLRKEFDELAADVEKLPDAVETDRRAIIAARRQDEQLLHDALDFGQIDPAALTAYLLQDEAAGPAGELIGWLRWARLVLPAETLPQGNGQRQKPDFRVRSLSAYGTAWVGGEPLELAGTVTDLASDPVLAGRPIQVRMTTAGALPLVLSATIDRTQAVAKDELSAQCQYVFLPKMRLGRSDRLRLSFSPSVAAMKIHVLVDGEGLSGEVEIAETQVHMTPGVGGDLARIHLAESLGELLRDVKSVAVRLSLAGTLNEPRWTLHSDLGPTVSRAMDRALTRAVQQHTHELLARSQRHIDEQLTRLDRQIADQQAALLPQLAGSVRALEQIAQRQQPVERLTPEYVGRRLPAGSLFR
jgi:uncharacterized protein (TIGR03545 family)